MQAVCLWSRHEALNTNAAMARLLTATTTIQARSSTAFFRQRHYTTTGVVQSRSQSHGAVEEQDRPAVAALSSRWLSDIKSRIGKCITFGLQPAQRREAGDILFELTRDWRELVAGSEGFLTSPQRRGLHRHKIVWGEQDSMGHVNNVMYNRYAESARVEWVQRYADHIDPEHAQQWRDLVTPKGYGVILRKITTDFKFPMRYPDRISVYHRLAVEPTKSMTSFAFEVLILSEKHQRVAARVTEDCSLYDYSIGKKTTLKPFMASVLRDTWHLQLEAKTSNSAQVQSLLDRVRKLETGSWDREGAVEDSGSASSR